jgi:hypothetical protein
MRAKLSLQIWSKETVQEKGEVQLHALLTSTVGGGEWSASQSSRSILGETVYDNIG